MIVVVVVVVVGGGGGGNGGGGDDGGGGGGGGGCFKRIVWSEDDHMTTGQKSVCFSSCARLFEPGHLPNRNSILVHTRFTHHKSRRETSAQHG